MTIPPLANAAGQLAGRHAVITGGSRGIGAAIARVLATHGASLTLMGRDAERLSRAAAELGGRHVTVDVASAQSVQSAFDAARASGGPIDILVNNAGIAESAPILRTDPDMWQRILDVNLTGTYLCTRAAVGDMLAQKRGRIVNVASTAGLTGAAYISAYCASKHGVIGFTRALALELARQGITVNAVCPGYTDTDMAQQAIATIMTKTGRTRDQAISELSRRNPQGRLITPEEVAASVAWLCLPGTESITGQAISISGGEVMA